MSPRRLGRLTASFALVVAPCLITGWAAASSSGCATGALSVLSGGWDRIRAPHFGAGSEAVTGVATAGSAANLLYATNGNTVVRSTDGGCTWVSSFVIGGTPTTSQPFTTATATVDQVVTTMTNRVYLLVADEPRLHVMVSGDAGRTWRLSDNGLAAAEPTRRSQLVPSSSPGVLYLLAHVGGGLLSTAASTDVVYTTHDDGASWSAAAPIAQVLVGTQGTATLNNLAVDPRRPEDIWAATSEGLLRSTDAGGSWTSAGIGGNDAMSVVDVAHDPGRAARILVFEQGRPVSYISTDGGSAWVASATPGLVQASAWGFGARDTAILAGGRIYQESSDSPATWASISNSEPTFRVITADHLSPSWLYACECGSSGGSLWRHAGTPPPASTSHGSNHGVDGVTAGKGGSTQCMPDPPIAPHNPDWGTASLSPENSQIVLSPGQTRKVSYTFVQPPREMDTFLVVDTGPRSEFSHCPFKYGAVGMLDALVNERNLRAGLADFGDYPGYTDIPTIDATVFKTGGSNYPYKLDRVVGSVDQSLYNQIANQISWWDGGTPNGDQSNMTALFQAATGAGQVVGLPAAPNFRIPGGLQAAFSRTAFKVAVHVAGNHFNDPDRSAGYPGPRIAAVKGVLQRMGIHQVGIWVNNRLNKQDGTSDNIDGHKDLAGMASATHALSPATVDCNGDGVADLHRGSPLVCVYIAPAEGDDQSHDPTMGIEMRRLLEAMVDPQSMSVVPLTGATAVASVSPTAYNAVDDLLGHTLHYDVTFRCGAHEVNQSHSVSLGAKVGDELWATASARVTCSTPVAPALRQAPPLPPPPPPPVTQPIPNPGVNPVVNPAPNPAPNPAQAPQAQPQPIANVVAVPAPQEQPQLAIQDAGRNLQGNEAMSALPAPATDPLRWAKRLGAYGGVAIFGLGAALSRRIQLARAVARTGTRGGRR